MNEVARQGGRRMTVREVAETLGVSVELITKKVKELFPEIVQSGKTTYMNEAQVTAVKMNLVKKYEVKTSLEKKLLVVQAMQILNEEVEQLKKELEGAQPKVEFFDQVADSKDALQMRDVAAALNMDSWGRNKIFECLRKRGVLDDRNIPYREYQDRGYFRVIEQQWTDKEGETHISLKTLVYQRGIDFIRRVLKQGGAA
jgi:anti-repressor protein